MFLLISFLWDIVYVQIKNTIFENVRLYLNRTSVPSSLLFFKYLFLRPMQNYLEVMRRSKEDQPWMQ
jgi:hypothetical protein